MFLDALFYSVAWRAISLKPACSRDETELRTGATRLRCSCEKAYEATGQIIKLGYERKKVDSNSDISTFQRVRNSLFLPTAMKPVEATAKDRISQEENSGIGVVTEGSISSA